jgi:hypothetical protein
VGQVPANNPIEVFAERVEKPIGTLGFAVRDHMAVPTVTSLLMSDFRWTEGQQLARVIVQGSQLPSQRNECVKHMQGDWILFIDDDMVWEAPDIGRLVATYRELKETVSEPLMVGGLCVRRAIPHQPTLYVGNGKGGFNFLEDWGEDIVEVDGTGCAFILIEATVFEAIMGGPMPPIEERLTLEPWPFFEWVGRVGEDLRFCRTAKDAGARLFVDTRIRVGHLSEKSVDVRDYWMYVAGRPQEMTDTAKQINDRFGIPTITRERALELLGGD